MNANNIESKFAAMGARIKVREIASRWRQGDRTWVSPADFAVDIRRDNAGEFFELRVPTITLPFWHRVMMNTETQSRTMANVAFLG